MPTQSQDVSGDPSAITYSGAGETWKILKKVEVVGAVQGVHSVHSDSVLDNNGFISGSDFGVYFQQAFGVTGYSITNRAKGRIEGDVGIETDWAGTGHVVNDGLIDGKFAGVYLFDGTDMTVENTGTIRADRGTPDSAGIYLLSYADGAAVVRNAGVLNGDWGIILETENPSTFKNAKDGIVKGATAAFYSFFEVSIENKGTIKNWVVTSAEDDSVVNKGVIDGQVALRAGDDFLKNKGEIGRIQSDEGNDQIILGAAAEKLLFDAALNELTNVDRVKKFESGKDRFVLDQEIFTELATGKLPGSAFHKGASAADPDDRIIYHKKSGALFYDPDGTGILAQVKFAQLDEGTKLKASDFSVIE